ncbi:MAG: hypothetical protein H8E66_05155 [Planctomycetes bacterium]|nr:hypothetical protein [Planctomycetota bacterium]
MDSNVDDYSSGLKPPRFSLAALFVIVGVLGTLFAAMSYVGTYATLLLILFALTIAAHVAGNAIGTQLRETGSRPQTLEPDAPGRKRGPIASTDFAPTSQLHHRSALGKPILVTTTIGSIAGAVLGGSGLAMLMEDRTLLAIMLGVIASAVLGGIWTFGASSFLQVASGALRQATRDSKH